LAERIKAHKLGLSIILATGFAKMPVGMHPDLIRLNKRSIRGASPALGEGLTPTGQRTVMPFHSLQA
jgi:hypothetical protein